MEEITVVTAFVAALSFAGGVVSNLLSSVLYDFSVGRLSFRSRDYPSLVGTWKAQVLLEGVDPFEEIIIIKGQINRRFKGVYTSPATGRLKSMGVVELEIEGFLLDHKTIRYVAQSSRNQHVDYVTGMAVISNDRCRIDGLSISLGVLTEEPTLAKVVFLRV